MLIREKKPEHVKINDLNQFRLLNPLVVLTTGREGLQLFPQKAGG